MVIIITIGLMMDLKTEVERFRHWASTQPSAAGEWETNYDDWPGLLAAAEQTLSQSPLTSDQVDLLLYCLARDNECQVVREMLESYPLNGSRLAEEALNYPDPQARWQAADFLGSQNGERASQLLREFVEDDDEYVRRRALLAAAKQDPEFAEVTAKQWISAVEDYSRLAALCVLHDFGSPYLTEALDRLRSDPMVYVRKKVAEIEGTSEDLPTL
jgi:HEAT repeat protein